MPSRRGEGARKRGGENTERYNARSVISSSPRRPPPWHYAIKIQRFYSTEYRLERLYFRLEVLMEVLQHSQFFHPKRNHQTGSRTSSFLVAVLLLLLFATLMQAA